jgi:hypothetical protein
MMYVGVPTDMRASAGAAILIKCTWKNRIHSCKWSTEGTVTEM